MKKMDFEKICRACSSEGELKSLFIEDNVLIVDMLTEITNLKVQKDDNYPQSICNSCLEKLKSAYEFKKQCQDVQNEFEQYLQNVQVNEKIIVEEYHQYYLFDYEIYSNWNDDENSSLELPVDSEKLSFEPTEGSENLDIKNIKSSKKKQNKRYRYTCTICNKTVGRLNLHLRTHTKEKPFKCETCGLEFSLRGNYQRHMRIHTGEKPHACTICGRRFIQSTALHQHIRIHTNETFKCNHCGRSFRQQSLLRYHIRSKHTDDATPIKRYYNKRLPSEYQCDVCQKKYTTKSILAKHKLIHREKSYLCSNCGKGFINEYGLKEHFKIHTGEKPHKCKICDKSFARISQLTIHQSVHTGERPYVCTICNQNFKQIGHLQTHKRTHSGEKLYNCSVCGKNFAENGNLTVHMRIHTGERPYVCPVCNKGFYDSSSMKRHQKKHFIDHEIVQEKSFDLPS